MGYLWPNAYRQPLSDELEHEIERVVFASRRTKADNTRKMEETKLLLTSFQLVDMGHCESESMCPFS